MNIKIENESVKKTYERAIVELIDFTGEKSIFECSDSSSGDYIGQ